MCKSLYLESLHEKDYGVSLHEDEFSVEGSSEKVKLGYGVLLLRQRCRVRLSSFKRICKIVIQFGAYMKLLKLLHESLHGNISVRFTLVDPILLLILPGRDLKEGDQIRSLKGYILVIPTSFSHFGTFAQTFKLQILSAISSL